MELREELPSDRPAVRDVHLQAFGDHGLAVADLVDTLRDTITPEDGLSLVADLDRQVVGHVMFTGSLLDARRRLVEVQVLSPLAVTPALHQRGIGSALVRHGLGILAERSVLLVFLEGDPGYYSRFGFTPGGGLGFRKPSPRIPDGAFQAVQLPEYEPWMTGTLVYAEPFWRHDAVGLRDPRHSDASADTAVGTGWPVWMGDARPCGWQNECACARLRTRTRSQCGLCHNFTADPANPKSAG